MKVLITGGSGLLGSALNQNMKNDYEILSPTRSELNLENADDTLSYIEHHKPDYCIHAAASVFGLGGHKLHPNKALLINSRIDNNLISALYLNPPKHLVYVGTVASYGYPYQSNLLTEQDFHKGIPHPGEYGYAMAKRFGLDLSAALNEHNVTVSYAVMTNLYGPGDNFNERTGHVVPSLISRAINSKNSSTPLEVWGRGTDTRDFMFSSDAAFRIGQLLRSQHEGLINVGTGNERSISHLVSTIANYLELESIHYVDKSVSAISHRVLDTSLLEGKFGVIPDLFEENIHRTIDWLTENKDRARS